MNILFVSDFSISQNEGGSQRSSSFLLEEGKNLGFNITEYNYDSSPINLLYNYDLVISSNLEAISKTQPQVINFLLNHKNHVRVERDSCLYFDDETRKQLFSKARKTFFLTEFQYGFFKEKYGDYFHNVNIVPSYVDSDIFFEDSSDKDIDVVYCGFIHPLKGSNNLAEWARQNKNRSIDVFGWGETSVLNNIDNIKFHGKIPHDEIANTFRRSNYIYHDPIVNEPFCRMTAEASLCGCKFVGNLERIGSLIEINNKGLDIFRDECNNAINKFWSLI
jgi:glycosyltransferase involved in cell wall biosynthesis